MKLLFIGDIYASHGRKVVAENLKSIVAEHSIDLVIANVENSAGGFGVTPSVVLAYLVMAGGLYALTKTGENVSYSAHEDMHAAPAE